MTARIFFVSTFLDCYNTIKSWKSVKIRVKIPWKSVKIGLKIPWKNVKTRGQVSYFPIYMVMFLEEKSIDFVDISLDKYNVETIALL